MQSVSSLLNSGSFIVDFSTTFDLTRDPDDLDDPRTTEDQARRYFHDVLLADD